MKKLLLVGVFAASTSLFGQVSLGIRIGQPPPPHVLRVRPRSPGPGYIWVDGYQYVDGGRYRWHQGYWTRPPFEGAAWVGPRYEGGQFFAGYWNGNNRRVEHDHRWDRGRDRDYHDDHRDDHRNDHR